MMKFNRSEFKWSEYHGVYHNATSDRPPSVLIRGKCMAHSEPGADAYNFAYSLNTPDNWHGLVDLWLPDVLIWMRQEPNDESPWWCDSEEEV